MSISKRITALFLATIMFASVFSFSVVPTSAVTDAEFVAPTITIPDSMPIPDNDMLTNNTSYYLAAGTRYQQKVTADFIAEGKSNRPGTINTQKYIVVHNTGAYPLTSTALSNHNYGKNTDASVSWHYTCGNDGIYQMAPVNEKTWHAGGDYWGSVTTEEKVAMGWVSDASNSSGIGIETATPGVPATGTFSGVLWNSDELYEWYEGTFDYTATYLAMLVASLCVRLNFNPYTQIVQHYNAAGKNCPEEMRYVFGTGGNGQFAVQGTYYKVFLDRMYDYYEAYGGSYLPTDTLQNTYYNPNSTVYNKGLYKSNSAITVYRAGNTSTNIVGTIAAGNVADVQTVGFNWGRVILSDGTVGWINLSGLTYVGNTYRLGKYRTSNGNIVDVTNINGTTATYSGGTADISTLTKVYQVTVTGDTAFGSATKYLADGETFTVSAAAAPTDSVFDIWELTTGYADIANKASATTAITVSGTDIVIGASYRDSYRLSVQYGTGAGDYKPGDVATVTARTRAGYVFTGWQIVSGSGTFGNTSNETTTFTTTSVNTTIKAVYETMGAIDTTGLTNYALNKSYTTAWKGSSSVDYYSTTQSDSSSTLKLTNGTKASGSFGTSQSIYASFKGTSGVAAFTIDLGQLRTITMVALCDIAIYNSFGDIAADSGKVEVSNDGITYTLAQSITDTLLFSYSGTTKIDALHTHRLDFIPVAARYVRVSFTSGSYVTSISEIEVYGSESLITAALTVQNGTGGGSYAAGTSVNVSANAAEDGYAFSGWSIVSGDGVFADDMAESTTFTIGTENTVIKANYVQVAKLELTTDAVSAGATIADGFIKGVSEKLSADSLYNMFKYAVTIKNPSGETVSGTVMIGTGYTVNCNGQTIEVVVSGDIDSNAVVSVVDLILVKAHVKNSRTLLGAYKQAGDIDGDGVVGTADIISYAKKLKG